MKIAKGAVAPSFQAKTHDGQPFDLAALRGQKVWLAFYRFASCPLCNYRVHELLQRYREFEEAGIKMVGVFHSPEENIARFVGKQGPPFPLIADPERRLYRMYGVEPSVWAMFSMRNITTTFRALGAGIRPGRIDGPAHMVPADFLLDPEGLVYDSYYGAALADHIPFERVNTFGADACLDMPEAAAG